MTSETEIATPAPNSYSPGELIAAYKAFAAAEAALMAERPAGCPRAAWRGQNLHCLPPVAFLAADTACSNRPCRVLTWALNGNPYDLWVWGGLKLIERIDLRADDVAVRLQRYVRVDTRTG